MSFEKWVMKMRINVKKKTKKINIDNVFPLEFHKQITFYTYFRSFKIKNYFVKKFTLL